MKRTFRIGTLVVAAMLAFASCESDDDATPADTTTTPDTETPSESTETDTPDDEKPGDETPNEVRDAGVVLVVGSETSQISAYHVIADVTSGTADIKDAQEILGSEGGVPVTAKDGSFFVNDFSGETFNKLTIVDGLLTEGGSVPNLGVNGAPMYTFIGEDQIFLSSAGAENAEGTVDYQVINTSTMVEEKSGTLDLNIKGTDGDATYGITYVSGYFFFEGKLYISYIEADADYALLYDQAQVAVFDAQTLAFIKTIESSKTSSLGSGFNPSAAIVESGDLYIASSTSNAWAYDQSSPSGIVRIKAGTSEFDDSYFFDLSSTTGEHTLGFLYLGNDKGIAQVVTADENTPVEYYFVDLSSKSASKLDIPASWGGYEGLRRSMVILGNGSAAIVSNNDAETAVYIVAQNGSVSAGIKYNGTDAIWGIKAY